MTSYSAPGIIWPIFGFGSRREYSGTVLAFRAAIDAAMSPVLHVLTVFAPTIPAGLTRNDREPIAGLPCCQRLCPNGYLWRYPDIQIPSA